MSENSLRGRCIMVGMGAFFLAACALPDYQPPPDNLTGGVGGSGQSASSGTSAGGMGMGGAGGMEASSSASSSSSGAGGSEEHETDCTNGQDDDGDTLSDCADSDCMPGYECVPEKPPIGFPQYGRVREATTGTAHVKCADGSNAVQGFYFDPWPSECTACECNPTAMCLPPIVSAFNDGICAGAETPIPVMPGKACVPLPQPLPIAIHVSPGQTMNQQCVGTTGAQIHADPWKKYVDFCPVDKLGAGCAAGNVCVAKSNPDFGNRVCAVAEGVAACPSGFEQQIVTSKNWADSRSCSACSCDLKDVVCEGEGIVLNNGASCQGLQNTPAPFGQCTTLANTGAQSLKVTPATPTLPAGACLPGSATGAVQTTQSITFCCSP